MDTLILFFLYALIILQQLFAQLLQSPHIILPIAAVITLMLGWKRLRRKKAPTPSYIAADPRSIDR